MNQNLPAFALLALAAWTMPAAAEAIYRCGDSYSQNPCPGGTLVQTDDARSASQRSQTTQAAQRDARLADEMEKARLKEEAKAAPAYISPPKPEPAKAQPEAKKPVLHKPKKPPYFTAVSPRKPGKPQTGAKKPTTKTPATKKATAKKDA